MTECSKKHPKTSTEAKREETQVGNLQIQQSAKVTCWFKEAEGEDPASRTILFERTQFCRKPDAQAEVWRGFQYNSEDPKLNGLQQFDIPTYHSAKASSFDVGIGIGGYNPPINHHDYPDWHVKFPNQQPTVFNWLTQKIDPKDCQRILNKNQLPEGYWH